MKKTRTSNRAGLIIIGFLLALAAGFLIITFYPSAEPTINEKGNQHILKRFETLLVNIEDGKTDVERTLIIKYNNTISAWIDICVTCIDNDIDIQDIDFNNPPDVVSLEQKRRWFEAVFDAERFYNANRHNISRELARKLKFEK